MNTTIMNSTARIDSYHRSSSPQIRRNSRLHSSTRQGTQRCRHTSPPHFLRRHMISLNRPSTPAPTRRYPIWGCDRTSQDLTTHGPRGLVRLGQSRFQIQEISHSRISRTTIESRWEGSGSSPDPLIADRIGSVTEVHEAGVRRRFLGGCG